MSATGRRRRREILYRELCNPRYIRPFPNAPKSPYDSPLMTQDFAAQTANAAGPVIVFDAMCVLCSANAQFILKHDDARHFRLASMQGDYGAALYRRHGIDPANPETLIVAEGSGANERVLRNSDAVLAIYGGLGWPWRAAAVLRVVPRVLRDPIYRWVARNRYRLFGTRNTCWLPAPEHQEQILS